MSTTPRNRFDKVKSSLPTATGRYVILLLMCREEMIPFGKTPTSGLPKSSSPGILLWFEYHVLGGNRRRHPTLFLLYTFCFSSMKLELFPYPSFSKWREEVLIWHGYLVRNTCVLRDIVAAHLCLLCFFHDTWMFLDIIGGTNNTLLGISNKHLVVSMLVI